MSTTATVIIKGLTKTGQKFRPSDWAERLCGAVASYDAQRRITYHPYVSMATIDSVKCVVIDTVLEQDDEMLYNFLMEFADENNLTVLTSEHIPEP